MNPAGSPEKATEKWALYSQRLAQDIQDARHRQPVLWQNPDVAMPVSAGRTLHLASFNIAAYNAKFSGANPSEPLNLEGVCATIASAAEEVVCVQECPEPVARQLAEKLGMNLAFANSIAILSRYPIAGVDHLHFQVPTVRRMAKALEHDRIEPLITRSILTASVIIEGATVDIVNTHLSLLDPAANATQMNQLREYVQSRQRAGHRVVLAGDFNANLALANTNRGVVDHGSIQTPTDTRDEWVERYGAGSLKNMGDPAVAMAARKLVTGFQGHWEAPLRQVRMFPGGPWRTPEESLRSLREKSITGSTSENKETLGLLRIVDGTSAVSKRYDNIFVSPGLKIQKSRIDSSGSASDHALLWTEIKIL